MHNILVPSPLHNQAGYYKIQAVWVHSETVTYRDTLTGRERKIENKKKNSYIYIFFFHIRTMHTTWNPLEKSHDCNINYTGIQRQY